MARIACRECNRQISDQAVACPHCGMLIHPVSPADPQEAPPPPKLRRLAFFLGAPPAVLLLLVAGMMLLAERMDRRAAQRTQLTVQRTDLNATQRKEAEARQSRKKVTASQYGEKWPFTVASGELECIDKAVILHTSSGTYNLNGTAMDRYQHTYKSFREIAKPSTIQGLANKPQAKMPLPSAMIQRGLDLCD